MKGPRLRRWIAGIVGAVAAALIAFAAAITVGWPEGNPAPRPTTTRTNSPTPSPSLTSRTPDPEETTGPTIPTPPPIEGGDG